MLYIKSQARPRLLSNLTYQHLKQTRERAEMVSSSLQRRRVLSRKLQILRNLTNSKSVKKSSIIMNGLLYICKLKLKLEAIKREYSNLMAIKKAYLELMKHFQVPKAVKVEKIGEQFMVRVNCNKGENRLVPILEAFEDMGLIILQASVSCNNLFTMEATCVAQNQQALDARDVTQVILKAIEKQAAVEGEISKTY